MRGNNIKKYKPSIYTHWFNHNGSVILYNSLYGVNGIKKYSDEHKNEVIAYLKKEEIIHETILCHQSVWHYHYLRKAIKGES